MRTHITYLMLTLTLVAMVYGCNTEKQTARHEKKARKYIGKAEQKAPNELAKWCAGRFDNTDSVNEKTIYKPGETITDTVTQTEYEIINDTVFITKERTIYINRVDTHIKTIYQRIVNTAAIDSMGTYVRKVDKKNATLTQQLKTWRSIGIGALIAIALYFIVKFIIRKFKG